MLPPGPKRGLSDGWLMSLRVIPGGHLWWGSFQLFGLEKGVRTYRFVLLQDMRQPQSPVAAAPARPRWKSTPLLNKVNISPSPSPSPQPAPILWHAIPSPQLHRYFFSVPFFFFMSSHHVHFLHHIGAARTPQHGRLPLALHRSILYNAQRHQPERHSRTQCMCRDHGLGIIHPPTVSMHQR